MKRTVKGTKKQIRAEARYRAQLRLCGFRSWIAASRVRTELISFGGWLDEERAERLEQLQVLAQLYLTWKTNDDLGRQARWHKKQLKRYGITES